MLKMIVDPGVYFLFFFFLLFSFVFIFYFQDTFSIVLFLFSFVQYAVYDHVLSNHANII